MPSNPQDLMLTNSEMVYKLNKYAKMATRLVCHTSETVMALQ